ncbi:MAG: hypothetical protein JSW58_11105 [Candidatus Latescibacterota bacterium]|nr:MAG: hypothetical protein JSW58_11105 [Candidatus Latescibacterota bacterium]
MRPRIIVTSILLLFVGASVLYLVFDETRHREAVEPPGDSSARQSIEATTASESVDHRVIVYYFHGNKRCNTCRTIEAYAEEAIHLSFPDEIKTGKLEWRVINVDEPENEHYVKDYRLSTRSVVLVDMENGVQQKWDNLDQVWQLVRNKPAFVDYIVENTDAYLADEDG